MTGVHCRPGRHGRLVGGLGLMGDAIICLSCGREKYEENWRGDEVRRTTHAVQSDWPAILAARAMPGGLDALVAQPDPDFDRWFSSGGQGLLSIGVLTSMEADLPARRGPDHTSVRLLAAAVPLAVALALLLMGRF